MIVLRVALALPLAKAHCHACSLATGDLQAELSLVQKKSEAVRHSSSSSASLPAGVSNKSRATDDREGSLVATRSVMQSSVSRFSMARALGQRQQQPPLSETVVLQPLAGTALGLPQALETAARTVTAASAAGSASSSASSNDSSLGILVIVLIAIVLVSCLVYLVLTHDATKGANNRGSFDRCMGGRKMEGNTRLDTTPQRTRVYTRETGSLGPRPFASPETSRLILEDPNPLPMICPGLVMGNARTRLAIPAEPLLDQEFEIDILGLKCAPLLTATLNSRGGRRMIQIAMHEVGTLLAKVTSGMQVLGADGAHFATLSQDGKGPRYVLREPGGRVLMTINCDPDLNEVQMFSTYAGRATERAVALRKPAGNLPAEHYEVTVNPQVDSVLVLAAFLGLKVFGMPRGSEVAMRSGSLFR